MTTRKDTLQRLQVASPCQTAWEAMDGDARRRFCLQCNKHVHDFAQLTPREIAGLLRASRGHVCARLTHDGEGRLVTLPPARRTVQQPASWPLQQVAAAVVSLLGLGSAACADRASALSAEAQEAAALEPGADRKPGRPHQAGGTRGTLQGALTRETGEPIAEAQVHILNLFDHASDVAHTGADGAFAFTGLRPGIYRIDASYRWQAAVEPLYVVLLSGEERQLGLAVPAATWDAISAEGSGGTTIGVLAMVAQPLRHVYDESALVVVATAGRTVPVASEDEWDRQVRTELVIADVLKGETGERMLRVVHGAHEELQAGQTVLAFLVPNEEAGRDVDAYNLADHGFGLKQLSATDLEAYGERIAALAPLTRDGAPDPADLIEWLVATAEDPATRGEAVGELDHAVRTLGQGANLTAQDIRAALDDFLAAGGTPASETEPAVLAAFLTEAHKRRLTRALLATERLAESDLELHDMVRPWSDGDRLLDWLIERVGTPGLRIDWPSRRAMRLIADELGDEALRKLVEQTRDDEAQARFLEALGGRGRVQ